MARLLLLSASILLGLASKGVTSGVDSAVAMGAELRAGPAQIEREWKEASSETRASRD